LLVYQKARELSREIFREPSTYFVTDDRSLMTDD